MQFEGLVLGEDISLANLKGALLAIAKKMFGEDHKIRLRPSFFPFTEPSVEVDVSCSRCNGKGCPTCKGTGWIEVLGAGMVNDNVLRMSGYDPEKFKDLHLVLVLSAFVCLSTELMIFVIFTLMI